MKVVCFSHRGNFASVYVAADTRSKEVVAAKCIDKKKTMLQVRTVVQYTFAMDDVRK